MRSQQNQPSLLLRASKFVALVGFLKYSAESVRSVNAFATSAASLRHWNPWGLIFPGPAKQKTLEDWKYELLILLKDYQDDNTVLSLRSPIVEPALSALSDHFGKLNVDVRYTDGVGVIDGCGMGGDNHFFATGPSTTAATSTINSGSALNYNGYWQDYCPPTFPGCLGNNDRGEPLYRAGRLTFGGIQAKDPENGKDLIVSVQKFIQQVDFVHNWIRKGVSNNDLAFYPEEHQIPDHLKEAIQGDWSQLRFQVLDTHFTSVEHPELSGILRMKAFVHPSLTTPNVMETWFVGGTCLARPLNNKNILSEREQEVQAAKLAKLWQETFGGKDGKTSKITSAAFLGDAPVEDKSLAYETPRIFTGLNTILYLDHNLRIQEGSLGTRMVNYRVRADPL